MPFKKKNENESEQATEKPAKKRVVKTAKEESDLNIENNDTVMYKGRPLVRRDDVVIYGNPDDPYLVSFTVKDKKEIKDLNVATNVVVQLMINGNNEDVTKNRPIKRAERDSLYDAIDIGVYWLEDILKQMKK